MEAGVGRGQRRGQRCTSCMLGNAALFPPTPISAYFFFFSSLKWRCTHLARTACTAHTHAQASSHLLLSPILIHSSKLVSIFPYLFLSQSLPHTLIHSLTYSLTPISISFIFALSLSLVTATRPAPTTPPQHTNPPLPPFTPSMLMPHSHL